jgi:hypothetical protein
MRSRFVQRPTTRFVPAKTNEQLDLQHTEGPTTDIAEGRDKATQVMSCWSPLEAKAREGKSADAGGSAPGVGWASGHHCK